MHNKIGNIWSLRKDGDIVVITTNGCVKSPGECVMGRGIAKQAAKLYPWLPATLGTLITEHGNRAFNLGCGLASMPVKPSQATFSGNNAVSHMSRRFKPGEQIPGWACVAQLSIIERSAKQLVEMADKFGWKRILMPRPGCGAGELRWEDVEPVLDRILDERFVVCTYS